mgnify:CR=1 FL=1
MSTGGDTGETSVTIPRRAWYALLLTSFGQFFVIFDSTALNVAFASIERSFPKVPQSTLAWTLTSYSIGTASLLLLAGKVADLFGRKRIFLTGISTFAIGSLAAGVAVNVPMLIASRAVQGAGGALMIPTSIALALPEFPPERRSLAVGVWGSIAALAGGLGPPFGALMIDALKWRGIFFINIPVVIAVVALGRSVLRESKGESTGFRVDVVSIPLGTIALAALTLGVLEGQKWGWTSGSILGCFAVAVVLLTVVVLRSRRHPEPLLDVTLFRRRRFTTASITTLLFNLPVSGFWFSAPLFMQTAWHWSVLKSGVAIMPTPIVLFFAATYAGRVSDRGRMKSIIGIGMALTAIAVFGFAFTLHRNANYWVGWFPWALLYGASLGLSWSTLTGAALVGIEPHRFGVANGTNLTFRTIGGSMGVAIVIAVLGTAPDDRALGFHRVYVTLAILFSAAVFIWLLAYPRHSHDN